ncbi:MULTISPECIES: hypothetical protein [Dehalococcoides]|jgi:hypothetical protein|uniref:Uncharacterized protein n=1 Tax=Dehalococcoides mccartyi (strain VS) TaxID=311424 RepID=D2BHA0_DEHMV|nr:MULTISPECIES: hypothetical protein [Dehalococcoides]ACZ61700.1 hypothetical protein DhcVS_548 [Dehalococcoides mccartyi VS]AHB13319.1 hypothetical protein GY50_0536 [Dehalococcoides mccartyi GY50]AII57748.1 hypothetical protein X792_02965 [Dehalococcoides mccartyi CG1]APH12229.1 hypothetical protein ASJ33_03165 [Dehalococcoides mccartyi]QYY58179.1 hypothetical protein CWV2_000034 [Dehalococcoides mccartyi]
MMVKIPCPDCGVIGSFSLADEVYEGPYKCWKCRKLFKIRIERGTVKLCEPIDEAEFERLKSLGDLKRKSRGGDEE